MLMWGCCAIWVVALIAMGIWYFKPSNGEDANKTETTNDEKKSEDKQ